MDFIKKKAFEAQINKVGKELGLGSNVTSNFTGGAGSSREQERQSQWSIFPSRRDAADIEAEQEDIEHLPSTGPAVTFYACQPKNFPPFINLFYIDRSILTDSAAKTVLLTLRILYCIEALLLFNIFSGILATVFQGGKKWIHLVITIVVSILLTVVQLIAYDTSFRGAYRNSTTLRRRYLFFAAGNIVMLAMYAFLGVAFWNGWSKVGKVGKYENESSETERKVEKALVIVEALGWTLLSLLNMYTLFEYYHLYRNKEVGLSEAAIQRANRTNVGNQDGDIPAETGRETGSEQHRNRNARIQEIRDRYRTET